MSNFTEIHPILMLMDPIRLDNVYGVTSISPKLLSGMKFGCIPRLLQIYPLVYINE